MPNRHSNLMIIQGLIGRINLAVVIHIHRSKETLPGVIKDYRNCSDIIKRVNPPKGTKEDMSGKTLYPRFLIKLPWWFDLILAAAVYYIFKYWLPTVHLQHSDLNRFVHALPQFSEIFAGILVINAIISALHAWRNKN